MLGTLDHLRSPATGFIRFAKFHLDTFGTRDHQVLITQYLYRICKQPEYDAFYLCVLYLLTPCRQFLITAAIHDTNLIRTKPQGTSCGIHSHIPTAHNDHVLTFFDGSVIFRELIRLHEIYTCQKLIRGIHAIEVLTIDSHEIWQSCTGSKEDRIELIFQFIDGLDLSDNVTGFHINAKLPDIIHLFLNYIFGKPELWNTVDQHSSCRMQCLEHSNFMSCLCKIRCSRKSGRSRPYNSDTLTCGCCTLWCLDTFFELIVGTESLKSPDRNRLFLFAEYTIHFALRLLWTNTSTNSRQTVRFLDLVNGTIKIRCFHTFDKCRNIDIYRASLDALRFFALDTPLGFGNCLFLRVPECNLFEIVGSLVSRLGWHWLSY